MTILDIVKMGHPVLRKLAAPYPVNDIGSAAFVQLIQDMQDTLHASGGIGLAAPQVNIPYQLAVIEIINTSSRYGEIPAMPFAVYINPVLTVVEDTRAGYWEGCFGSRHDGLCGTPPAHSRGLPGRSSPGSEH